MLKKVLIGFVAMVVLLSTSVSAGGWDFSGCSDWARDGLEDAMINGITTYEYENYKRDITRAEFAEVIMNLYFNTMGFYPEPADVSTFTDTTDLSVLMANRLGIINGKGSNKFVPDTYITRQEMAVMIKRAIDAMGIQYTPADGILSVLDHGKVDAWAVAGVDFNFEKGFMKGDGVNFDPLNSTPIEQGIIIVNRVFLEYGLRVPNDYTQGYTTQVTAEGLQVTYNNNMKSEVIVSLSKAKPMINGGMMTFGQVKDVKQVEFDRSKIYFLDGINRLFFYDFNLDKCYQYSSSYGGALNVQQYSIVSTGSYLGYLAVETLPWGASKNVMYAYDANGDYIGDLEMMTDLNYQIGEMVAQKADEAAKFAIQVMDATNFPGLVNFYESDLYFFSSANHHTYVSNGVGYLTMSPYKYDDSAYNGPIGRLGTTDSQVTFNGTGAIYKVDLQFNTEKGNGGIVFNLRNSSNGNDNYSGYYVGIDPVGNTVEIGKSQWKWTSLKNVGLGYDIGTQDTVSLEVIKSGSNISVFVNGRLYISIKDSTYADAGGFGVRTWNSDVTYSNFSVNPLP